MILILLILTIDANAHGTILPTPINNEVNFYQRALTQVASQNADQQMQQSLATKLYIAAKQARDVVGSTPPPKNSNFTPDFPVTPRALPTGIFKGGVGIFHEGEIIKTMWQGIVIGFYYQVFSGSMGDDHTQGVIFVHIMTQIF